MADTPNDNPSSTAAATSTNQHRQLICQFLVETAATHSHDVVTQLIACGAQGFFVRFPPAEALFAGARRAYEPLDNDDNWAALKKWLDRANCMFDYPVFSVYRSVDAETGVENETLLVALLDKGDVVVSLHTRVV